MPLNYNPYLGPTYLPQPYQQPVVQQPQLKSIEWVEGEVGAQAFQLPVGWPANTPIPLWDSRDTVIYLKSVNPMGVPSIVQKLRYSIEEAPVQAKISGQAQDTTQFVTKDDLDKFKKELRQMINSKNQNGSNQERNRGDQA